MFHLKIIALYINWGNIPIPFSTHPHIPVGLLVESHINNMLNFTATQKPEMNHEKYPVFPSHENGFPRGYNHLQSIFIHFSSTRLYNLQYFSIFWVPQPNCGWVSRISFEKWRLRIFVYLFWAPGRPFSGGRKRGKSPTFVESCGYIGNHRNWKHIFQNVPSGYGWHSHGKWPIEIL